MLLVVDYFETATSAYCCFPTDMPIWSYVNLALLKFVLLRAQVTLVSGYSDNDNLVNDQWLAWTSVFCKLQNFANYTTEFGLIVCGKLYCLTTHSICELQIIHKNKIIPSVSFRVSRDSASRRLARRRVVHSRANCRKVSQNTSVNAICQQHQQQHAIATAFHQHQ